MHTSTHNHRDLSALSVDALREIVASHDLTSDPFASCRQCGRLEPVAMLRQGHEHVRPVACTACDPDAHAAYEALRAAIKRAADAQLASRQAAEAVEQAHWEASQATRRQADAHRRLLVEIGPKNAACSFENFVPTTASQQKAIDALRSDWASVTPFLLLAGKPGTGKTHLAVATYRSLQTGGGTPVFVTETQFLHEWREAARNRENFDGVARLMNAQTLIFDDIGTSKYTDGSLELLFQVIDHRSRFAMPTLFTTNHLLESLEAKLGEKLVSRIVERDLARVILIDGANHRMRSAG